VVKILKQQQKLFHRDERYPHTHHLGAAPTEEELDIASNPDNADNPLCKIIGQRAAKKRLCRAQRVALKRYNHLWNDLHYLLTGPKGVGKTTLARSFAKSIKLPYAELSPAEIKTPQDLFDKIASQLERQGLPLVADDHGVFTLPPCVILVDEAHDLKGKRAVVTALLKAIAVNDRMLCTEKGVQCKTRNVCWMMATTDRGDLFDALDDRMTEIALGMYTQAEIAEIVELNYGAGNVRDGLPVMPPDACKLVAHYRPRQPRKALEFAREVRTAKRPGVSWREAIEEVAGDVGIDKWGWDKRLVQIITILGQKPVAKDRLPTMIGVKEAELKNYHLPFLLTTTDDQEAFVTVTGEGYTITQAGLDALDVRGIAHKGRNALRSES
jgi:Holliday junction resolvasome RuvABC ATP-dependent DNA helicase subunit